MKPLVLMFILLSATLSCLAQGKVEREVRIKEADVPAMALAFVDSLPFNRKVRWYQEFGLDMTSIEAKTRYKRKYHSVEFNTDGVLEDLEVTVSFTDIPAPVQGKMGDYFAATYKKFSIEKAQIQYVGSPSEVVAFLREALRQEALAINYEIVLATQEDGVFKRFEYLFSEAGDFIKQTAFLPRNADHIEY